MNILVTYDVSTKTPAGRTRLRRVAQACVDYGQRVQWSVFECTLSEKDLAQLRLRLLDEIKPDEDSLRIYYLVGNLTDVVESYGIDRKIDFDGPLIL